MASMILILEFGKHFYNLPITSDFALAHSIQTETTHPANPSLVNTSQAFVQRVLLAQR